MSCAMEVMVQLMSTSLRSSPYLFFFSSRRRHTRSDRDWSSDVCSSDLGLFLVQSRGTARIGAVFGPVMLVWFATIDRKSVVEGKSVDLGGCRIIKKKKNANVACHVISCLSG